jgi:hypothetical protein
MKNTIRITKHKGIDIGYCNCCHAKNDIYQIRITSTSHFDIRLCPDCMSRLEKEIKNLSKSINGI